MDFLIALVRVMYLPMLFWTLLMLGVLGLGVSLYTHRMSYVLLALLLAFPLNLVVIVVYLLFIAKFR
ncbi:MAG: hypothetical protein A3I44_02895 [Candidatus Sungbacteria bacterium RIFCSPLOWO2_02_FULL_51_17]|uniref:Uncharacterized protein n=1 Tax=Candidatus Sungbacteria bacterium RIFCSPHIGHO2_02_FULL_51_29 TaxID=1802273 RepID=A0A1G2KWV7_9BACT|nr:MAG: hypothetical protein A3C16_01180 [Candidatus Sungbacteria bacterium RIFCSPHIGHO2_02_FULL_51_29]OHA05987.1 MAG: hypothetical protein A3B29_03650 [Candidatus Sungbacteria bacterium RIFCSPLOWO2_01_FULL_51_34]OHA10842.1 MAG: hypothetical protein A3I44_02895 [Candidatus Sungbacteria bacterium RIFCSPLOWO2_02_FULL_51_17]